ncbi:HupE/UreJ family protein [Aquabacterium sp. J223]|uniref:HupE/UreJ family protein n=1 Tax=Aquabacterium sp. J223 TaxID=2898431 RepID=UPI0021AD9915|nr:HupE/UreJ family protein [Aquabacterium sp. J223]UUX95742.1 HupE/UreJ family protein [Aquabacterium sp. J223]
MTAWLRPLAGLLLALAAAGALAHKASDSYLSLAVHGAQAEGRWDIALRDLEDAVGLDLDGDGDITWAELRARHADIVAHALPRLQASADGRPCRWQAGAQQVDRHTDGAYTVIPLTLHCDAPIQRLVLRYGLFAELDPQHRGLLQLQAAGVQRSAVFGPARPEQTFDLADADRWAQFVDYAREGVWHIWIGADHLLFLLSLLLPSALLWREGRWRPAPTLGAPVRDVVRTVTAFTVAHSITLALAVLGWVSLPSRVVESAIALSVLLAALNNLRPVVRGPLWRVAFAFGLLHGFGFAGVLGDLGLAPGALGLSLLGFNLGVEFGQLVVVAVVLPLAFSLRRTAFYRRVVHVGGSVLIALLALVWLLERSLDLRLLAA